MTMGQDEPYKIVDELPANEFYNLEGSNLVNRPVGLLT